MLPTVPAHPALQAARAAEPGAEREPAGGRRRAHGGAGPPGCGTHPGVRDRSRPLSQGQQPPPSVGLGLGLPREAEERGRRGQGLGSGEGLGSGRAWSKGSVPLSADPPGGPEDGVAELSESVHLSGEPAAARGSLPPGEPAGGDTRPGRGGCGRRPQGPGPGTEGLENATRSSGSQGGLVLKGGENNFLFLNIHHQCTRHI